MLVKTLKIMDSPLLTFVSTSLFLKAHPTIFLPPSGNGEIDMNLSKNRLQHQREATTETMGQTGDVSSRPQPSSDVNVETQPQPVKGIFVNTNKPTFGKSDLESLRKGLKKSMKKGDFSNLSDDNLENAVTPDNPADKKPVAVSRSATFEGSSTHSASSTSSKRLYRLWQCAHCQTVNEAYCDSCKACKLLHGKMANRSYLCEFCQLATDICSNKERKSRRHVLSYM